MSEYFTNGQIIDWIIWLIGAELILLIAYNLISGNGIPFPKLLPNILSGLSLIVAIRIALSDAWWGWLALCLTIALLSHLFDLRSRWTRNVQQ